MKDLPFPIPRYDRSPTTFSNSCSSFTFQFSKCSTKQNKCSEIQKNKWRDKRSVHFRALEVYVKIRIPSLFILWKFSRCTRLLPWRGRRCMRRRRSPSVHEAGRRRASPADRYDLLCSTSKRFKWSSVVFSPFSDEMSRVYLSRYLGKTKTDSFPSILFSSFTGDNSNKFSLFNDRWKIIILYYFQSILWIH